MKMNINIRTTVDVKTLFIKAGVRYWQDGEVNGQDDISFEEQEKGVKPRMPFAVLTGKKTGIAPKGEYQWQIKIDLESGKILDWPQGTTAKVHYKTCDDNTFIILDEHGNQIGQEYMSYVPPFLGEEGDYIIFEILEDGTIKDFRCTGEDIEDLIEYSYHKQ